MEQQVVKTDYIAKINQETGVIEGYYVEDIHGKEVCDRILSEGGMLITEELWQKLLSYGMVKVDMIGLSRLPSPLNMNDTAFGIELSDLFSFYEGSISEIQPQPTEVDLLKEKVQGLENKIDELTNQMTMLVQTLNK